MLTLNGALLLAACGGSSAPAAKPPAPRTAPVAHTCEDVARTFIRVIEDSNQIELTDDQAARLSTAATTSCHDDAWSAELIACAASAEGDGQECHQLMSKTQEDGLVARVTPVLEELLESRSTDDAPPPPASKLSSDPCEGGE